MLIFINNFLCKVLILYCFVDEIWKNETFLFPIIGKFCVLQVHQHLGIHLCGLELVFHIEKTIHQKLSYCTVGLEISEAWKWEITSEKPNITSWFLIVSLFVRVQSFSAFVKVCVSSCFGFVECLDVLFSSVGNKCKQKRLSALKISKQKSISCQMKNGLNQKIYKKQFE